MNLLTLLPVQIEIFVGISSFVVHAIKLKITRLTAVNTGYALHQNMQYNHLIVDELGFLMS